MNSFEIFDETKWHDKEDFYILLKYKHISEEDCSHAVKIGNKFQRENMGEYHHLYIKPDVFLLADVFEQLSKCVQNIADVAGLRLDIISNVDIYLLINKIKRVGISYTTQRDCKVNNKLICEIL